VKSQCGSSRCARRNREQIAAGLFFLLGIVVANICPVQSAAQTSPKTLEIWYKPNVPLGIARGIYPGRVVWGHNPKLASWDGKTGFWWEDRFNDQAEADRLFSQTLFSLTNTKNENKLCMNNHTQRSSESNNARSRALPKREWLVSAWLG
jgi:hypothetical protein